MFCNCLVDLVCSVLVVRDLLWQCNLLSRECRILSCLPKPSFADMACRVGDMSAGHVADTRKCCVNMSSNVRSEERRVGKEC